MTEQYWVASLWLRRIDARNLRTLLISLVFAIGVGVGARLIWPDITKLQSLYARAGDEVTLDINDAIDVELKKEEIKVARLRETIRGMLHSTPRRQLESFVLGKLQELSWKTDMELISMRPSNVRQISVFEESQFHIKLRGSYTHLFEWLSQVSDQLPFLVLHEYELKRIRDASGNILLDVGLVMASYGLNE